MQKQTVEDWSDFFGERFPILPNLRHIDLTLSEHGTIAVAFPRPSHIFDNLPTLTLIDFAPIIQSAFPVLDSLAVAFLKAYESVVATAPPPALTRFCLVSYQEHYSNYNDEALVWLLSTSHSSLIHLSTAIRCNILFSSLANLQHLTLYRCEHGEDRRTGLPPVLDGLSSTLLSVTFSQRWSNCSDLDARREVAAVSALLPQLPSLHPSTRPSAARDGA